MAIIRVISANQPRSQRGGKRRRRAKLGQQKQIIIKSRDTRSWEPYSTGPDSTRRLVLNGLLFLQHSMM